MKTILLAAVAATLLAAPALAAPTDLSTWTREGTGGTWTVAADKHSVTQSVNGTPTIFYSDFNAQGRSLSGSVRVNTSSDDDFIGFVVGFNPGDLAAPSDFLLIDWKQIDQGSFGGVAQAGLAVSRVTGGLGNNAGAWWHSSAAGVTELARGATLHDTGWVDFTTYTFDIDFTPTNLKVSVNGVQEFNINGAFSDGRFGFYNYSQAAVTYAGIEDDILPPPPIPGVPEPATWAMLIMGFGGAGAMMRRRRAVAA
jgi:hypothetical protein